MRRKLPDAWMDARGAMHVAAGHPGGTRRSECRCAWPRRLWKAAALREALAELVRALELDGIVEGARSEGKPPCSTMSALEKARAILEGGAR